MKLPIRIEQNATHFASSQESVTIRVGKIPSGKRVDRMTLTIVNRNGAQVHAVTWPGKDQVGPPPTSFVWDGADVRGGFVNPIGSPFEISLEAELSDLAPVEPPRDVPRSEGSMAPCPLAGKAGVKSVVFVSGGARSTSYGYDQSGIDDLVIPGGKQGRFFLAPGAEDGVRIEYELIHPDLADRAWLALFDGKDQRVWQKDLAKPLTASGSLDAAELMPLLLAKDAPYKLKLSIEGPALVEKKHVAWTYVDVAVESIELFFGSARMLGGRDASVLREERLLLRKLKGMPEPKDGADLLADDDAEGLKAVGSGDAKLELSSSAFYQDTAEWAKDTAFQQLKSIWGDGPRIPIVAKVKVRSSAGKPVEAPSALQGATILWDWEDPKADKRGTGETKEWLAWAQERYGHTGDEYSPASTNCHAEYGGKRGQGATPVFPAQGGGGELPFRVDPMGAGRPWAALSSVDGTRSSPTAGQTGVLFQPSRMAGDTYRVRAYLYTGEATDFDWSQDAAKAAQAAGLPTAVTGSFEVWRRVEILRYLKKGARVTPLDLDKVNEHFAPARLKLAMAKPQDDRAVDKIFGDELKKVFQAPTGPRAGLATLLAPLDGQKDSQYALTLKSWQELTDAAVDKVLADRIAALGPGDEKTRLERVKTKLDRIGAGRWRSLMGLLTTDDAGVDALKYGLQPYFGKGQSIVEALPQMAVHLAGYNVRTSTKSALVDMVNAYVKGDGKLSASGTPLGGAAGLFVLHVDAMYPGLYDLAGSAIALANDEANRGRGLLFVSYPSRPDDVLVIDPTGKGARGDFVAQKMEITISGDFKDAYPEDYDAVLTMVANGCSYMAARKVVDDKGWDDPAGALAGKGQTIKVQSRNGGLVTNAKTKLERALRVPAIGDAPHDHSERDVYLTLTADLDRSTAKLLEFGVFSETPGKKSKRRMCEFVRDAYDRGYLPVSDVYVHYKRGSARARRRKDAAVQYLRGLFTAITGCVKVNPGPKDHERGTVYDVNALFAHEIAHTLFLPHASPEMGEQPWRHVNAYPCLMNYDPSHAEFCGVCQLALRGWDIGTQTTPKLADGPDWRATKEAPAHAPVHEVVEDGPPPVELPPPSPDLDPAWEHAGYHGTSSNHHASLLGGLRAMGSKWDPASGGELGPGFYFTSDFGTACLYGAASGEINSSDVDVWEVEWKVAAVWGQLGELGPEHQYGKTPEIYCRPPYDYLVNAAEANDPTQYKINEHAYDKIRLKNPRRMSVREAHHEADQAHAKAKPAERATPTIKAKGDGDCFFSSVAYHVETTALERAPFAGGGRTFGDLPEEKVKARAVRVALANWLANEIFGKLPAAIGDNEAPSTENGRKYLATWKLLTSDGTDTSHFGRNLAETIRNMPFDAGEVGAKNVDLIWGDAGFMWRAVVAVYNRKLLVHHGGRVPAAFGDAGDPIHVVHSGNHYDILRT